MSNQDRRTRIHVDDSEGRVLADSMVARVGPDLTRAELHVEPGHLPTGTRTRLVDAVLDDPDVRDAGHLTAAIPRGDAEVLARMQERCEHVETRAAGASVMVEADVPKR